LTTGVRPVFYLSLEYLPEVKTPDLNPRVMELELDYVNKLLGLALTAEQARDFLERMRYGVSGGRKMKVSVPAYRTDVLHPIDLVEDIAISYGYENFVPEEFRGYSVGERDGTERFSAKLRELMVGAGFQEVMTLVLTNTRSLFGKMNLKPETVVEAENPVTVEHSVARNWLLPSLFTVLEKNKTQEYPQKIFEVGDCLTAEGETRRRLAGVIAHSKASFSEMKSALDGILDSLGLSYTPKQLAHGSFIKGRCISTGFGFYGEVSPTVLENFGMEVPVAAFELDVDLITKNLYQ